MNPVTMSSYRYEQLKVHFTIMCIVVVRVILAHFVYLLQFFKSSLIYLISCKVVSAPQMNCNKPFPPNSFSITLVVLAKTIHVLPSILSYHLFCLPFHLFYFVAAAPI